MSQDEVKIDQATARCLFENCAFLFIAGVPNGTEFSIDLSSYPMHENFRGVKMIPEGAHYISCAVKGAYGDIAPRVGFMYYFKPKEIVVREWDDQNEELRRRNPDQEILDIERLRENLKDFDRFLAPYDFDQYSNWRDLSKFITETQVLEIMPRCGLVRTAIEFQSCPDSERPRGGETVSPRLRKLRTIADEDDLLPNLQAVPGTAPNFMPIPKVSKKSTPSEISAIHLDSIKLVDQLLRDREDIVLGEIQFSFLLLLCGHSTDALAHWRRILGILCNSESAAIKYRSFYKNYLTVLQYQLPELPAELLEPTVNNSVYQDTRKLVKNCIEAGLGVPAEQFKRVLGDRLLWTFIDLFEEDPEDLPVIVEI